MIKGVTVGDVLSSIEKTINQERIMDWARISNDFNRIHVDPEYAEKTRFMGTIAHGPMSLAFLIELMMEDFGAEWTMGGKLMNVRFMAPIRPGDRIKIGGVVKRIFEEGREQFVECDLFIEKGEGGKAVVGQAIGRIGETRS